MEVTVGNRKDTSTDPDDGLETPEDIAAGIEGHLKTALEEISALMMELDDGNGADDPALEEAE